MTISRGSFYALALTCAMPLAAQAEIELNLFAGVQAAPHSIVTATEGGTTTEFTAAWDGKPFAMPPYYGVRATKWVNGGWGYGVEFTHDKIYATDATLSGNGYDVLEFSDGLNILTANVMYRWDGAFRGFTPYVGGGLGISVPHVEVQKTAGAKTYGYQYTGPALRLTAGLKYAINDRWSIFGEYQGTYSMNSANLDTGPADTLKTNVITNALNFGVGFSF